jgi:predicted RNase H-like HicB family nuclease
MTYTVVIEKTDTGFGIHVPDLPGCVATGTTRELTVERITEAIRIHVLGFREDGLQIPVPRTTAESITIEI